MSNNPYLLHGDELARTEAARKTGATPKPRAGEALNPKAAWPFPKTRAELEAEIITLVEALQNLVEAVNDPDADSLYELAAAKSLLAKHGR